MKDELPKLTRIKLIHDGDPGTFSSDLSEVAGKRLVVEGDKGSLSIEMNQGGLVSDTVWTVTKEVTGENGPPRRRRSRSAALDQADR
jgi:hypothetical protein